MCIWIKHTSCEKKHLKKRTYKYKTWRRCKHVNVPSFRCVKLGSQNCESHTKTLLNVMNSPTPAVRMRLAGHQISKPIMKTDFIFSWKQSKREAEDKSVRVTHFTFPLIARMWARQSGRVTGMSIFFGSECHGQITRFWDPHYVTLNTTYRIMVRNVDFLLQI